VAAHTAAAVCEDTPEPFFLERYRVAYAEEIKHFFEVLATGKTPRTNIEDGVKALELAEAATLSWREGRPLEL
jgi:myo-inositol 2-dehydrogenase / D-chiro-inositol 1-dehydrogenase